MQAYAPTGKTIVATADMVPGNALITEGSWQREPDGTLSHGWVGETIMCWDGQYTTQRDGKDLFVDEAGELWTEDQLVLKDGE